MNLYDDDILYDAAWNDGKIRVFTPESGRLMLIIHNAHSMGVTAITGTSDCTRLVSGGGEGQVRFIHNVFIKLRGTGMVLS